MRSGELRITTTTTAGSLNRGPQDLWTEPKEGRHRTAPPPLTYPQGGGTDDQIGGGTGPPNPSFRDPSSKKKPQRAPCGQKMGITHTPPSNGSPELRGTTKKSDTENQNSQDETQAGRGAPCALHAHGHPKSSASCLARGRGILPHPKSATSCRAELPSSGELEQKTQGQTSWKQEPEPSTENQEPEARSTAEHARETHARTRKTKSQGQQQHEGRSKQTGQSPNQRRREKTPRTQEAWRGGPRGPKPKRLTDGRNGHLRNQGSKAHCQ